MENQLIVSLRKNKLLKNVDISKLDLRNIKGRLITISEGEILYREGDYADHIYLVVSGEVNLLKKRLLGKTKSFVFNEDDFFGQEEFLEEMSRTSTSVALRDTYLIALSKEEIEELTRLDNNVFLNMREPITEKDDETNLRKSLSVEPTKFEKAFTTPLNVRTQDEYNELQKTKSVDHAETHEFFQSLSDSSRFEESNLVQPLDKIEPTKDDLSKTSEMSFGADIYNEDGIIKSEFELPEIQPEKNEKKPEATTQEFYSAQEATPVQTNDLNDALFQMLSGNTAPLNEPEKKFEKPFFEEPPLQLQEDDFFAAMKMDDSPSTDPYSSFSTTEFEPLKEEPLFEAVPLMPPQNNIELPKPIPPYKPIQKDYNTEDIFAEADAAIKALRNNESIVQSEKSVISTVSTVMNEPQGLSNDELKMIIRAAELVNSTIKVDEVLRNIVDVALELTSADRGTLYLVDAERNEMSSMVAIGNEIREIKLKVGEGLAGFVAKSGETINIKDVQNDSRFNRDIDKSSGYKTKSMICFPIKNNKKEIIGVLQLLNSKNGYFSNRDEVFLEALSIHSAIALRNADLVEKLLAGERVNSLGKMANFLIQDIKKPVLVSKRYAEHLLNKELPKETLQIIQMLLEQLVHVADLIQTTSSYSEGKTMLRTSNVSLNGTLTDFASRVDTYVSSRSCQIFNELEKDVTVKLDVKEFFQSYMHIIKNACDAMPEGGSIFVATKRETKFVKIFFRDNGLGIPEGYKEKIFEPFMSYGKKEGTGLGLAITKKILEAHNATIEAESTTGSGSTFVITLPISTMY
jgi:CRP-like cAMP-binding protein/putative methionine-R-sulfoxide reductase with GAF domain